MVGAPTIGDPPKVAAPDIPVPTGRFGRPETAPSRDAPVLRQPSFTNRESWSRGVQMPVPEEGPAMPFGTDDGENVPEAMPAQHAAAQSSRGAETASLATQSDEAEPTIAGGVQMRAEMLPSAPSLTLPPTGCGPSHRSPTS